MMADNVMIDLPSMAVSTGGEMTVLDESLKTLIDAGKEQGFLTFTQVNEYLPDEAVSPEKLDQLLMSIEQLGLEIVNDEKLAERLAAERRAKNAKGMKSIKNGRMKEASGEDSSRRIDDPVRR